MTVSSRNETVAKTRGLRLLWVLALLLSLAACETVRRAPPAEEPASPQAAERAEQAGEYVLAAREYERLAKAAQPPQRQSFELRAAQALLKAGQLQGAAEILERVDVSQLDPTFLARKRTLQARLAVSEGRNEQAIRLLDQASRVRNLNPMLLAEIFEVRTQAELSLANPIGAVQNLIAREQYIVDQKALDDNQLKLWQILNGLSRSFLQSELTLARDEVLRGWIELALVARAHAGRSRAFRAAVTDWRKSRPAHPARDTLLSDLATLKPGHIGRVEHIGVLLPLSSGYRLAAEAVRDAILAMDAANVDSDKPKLSFYDIGTDPLQTPAFYEMAVREGAQLVIGPLGKEATEQIVRRASLSVPTILLGHVEHDSGSPLLFQLGLPPEQEARQAAERAYLDGHRHAAVLHPYSQWGERMASAFVSHWQRLGGIVLSSQSYLEEQNDYSEPISQLLNIVQSQTRKELIESLVGRKLEFEPRPRQDIDFIFLAANAKHGRLIKPQLNYHHAARVPVYATSHIFTGKEDPIRDADLDGIQFGDMPWMLAREGRIAELRARVQHGWPYARSELDRLYALGMDAYNIVPHLDRIATDESTRFNGMTSGLSLERNGRLHRQLQWARFHRGVPKITDRF